MLDEEIADCLDLMLECIELIENRFLDIRSAGEFVQSADGVTLLDAISMRLQVVGESVRRIQKTDPSFLSAYSHIEWDKIARFRDLVSHHYEQIDHEIVYDICKVHIPRFPKLKHGLQKIRFDSRARENK